MLATFRNNLPTHGGLTLASRHMTSDLDGVAGRYLSRAGSVAAHPGAITGPVLDLNVWAQEWPVNLGGVR